MSLLDSVRRAVAVLSAESRVGVLVGGLGVSARAEPRFTRDADLVVAVDTDVQAESVVHAFIVQGYRVQALLEQSGVDRLSGARLIDPDGIEIDLLTASSGIEPEIVVDAEEVEIVPGLRVHVATTGHLIALKLLSVAPGRETDAADLRSLARVADAVEWERAAVAVSLITERGFHRGRALSVDLANLRSDAS